MQDEAETVGGISNGSTGETAGDVALVVLQADVDTAPVVVVPCTWLFLLEAKYEFMMGRTPGWNCNGLIVGKLAANEDNLSTSAE